MRADNVVTVAREVAGRIVARPIVNNEYLHEGELLTRVSDWSEGGHQIAA
jgi:multidrug resistance efflux pump